MRQFQDAYEMRDLWVTDVECRLAEQEQAEA
jgi:hypothetical protein